jgi:pyruvate dehydrogenase E1 component alpha subunit
MLAYGIDPKVVMAELTGRQAGISRGKGGSMHMFSTEHFYGGHGIVGRTGGARHRARLRQQIPRGWGQYLPGLFRRRRGQPGPGLRELQHGRLWKLPIVYASRTTSTQWAPRQALLGRDGVLPPWRPASAFRACRSTAWTCSKCAGGPEIALPTCAEARARSCWSWKTYRYRGHSMSDPAKYRSREEVQAVREKSDPIELVKRRVGSMGKSVKDS